MTGCVIREVILLLHKGDRAVIVTMIPVRVVKMAIDQIIGMVTMRHSFMSAVRSMYMAWLMTAAMVVWRTQIWVSGIHEQHVLIYMVTMGMVEMPVMQIIYVIAVLNCCVTASCTMLMLMMCMMFFIAGRHKLLPDG
ncbi:hypothetical protein XB02_07375 [Pantoea ananatis]|nr:hypothetical protein XB02_07375 [Pantoea ananatis]